MRYKMFFAGAIFFASAAITTAQFSAPTIFDADGYLHIRMSDFIRHYGLRYDFHWARYSLFAQHFADKDFLYHVITIPFTYFSNIYFGAKIAAVLFSFFLLFVFTRTLKRYCLKWLVPVYLLALLLAGPFFQLLCRVRPMVFMIALTILFIHFLIVKNRWGLFFTTLVYALSHVSSPLLLVFVLITETVRYVNEKEFSRKNLLIVSGALCLGFLIHPNFPNNLAVFYYNGIWVPIYAMKWGLELGAEFFPIDTRDFIIKYPLVVSAVVLFAIAAASSGNRIKVSTKMWLANAGFFFVLSYFSRRYIDHLYPLLLIASGAYLTDWWNSHPDYAGKWALMKKTRVVLFSALAVFFIFLGSNVYKGFKTFAQAEYVWARHYENVAKWMRLNVPAGQTIFHTNWSDSQYLIGLNPGNDYFVTFDPIYMFKWNPKKYALYREISFGNSKDPYTSMKEEFDVTYGYAGKNYFAALIEQIRNDSRFQVMAEDNLGLIFRLR